MIRLGIKVDIEEIAMPKMGMSDSQSGEMGEKSPERYRKDR